MRETMEVFWVPRASSFLLSNSEGIAWVGGDPVEILPFVVKGNSEANIMIVRASGSGPLRFKYIAFRGELQIMEHPGGTSTIVGQANAAGAMTVGAVRYLKTPAFVARIYM